MIFDGEIEHHHWHQCYVDANIWVSGKPMVHSTSYMQHCGGCIVVDSSFAEGT